MSSKTPPNLRSSVLTWFRPGVPDASAAASKAAAQPAAQVGEPAVTAEVPAVVAVVPVVPAAGDNKQAAAWLEMRRAAGWKPLE